MRKQGGGVGIVSLWGYQWESLFLWGAFRWIFSITSNVLDHQRRGQVWEREFLPSLALKHKWIKISPVQWGPQHSQSQGGLGEFIRLIHIPCLASGLPPFKHLVTSLTFCYHCKDPLFSTWTMLMPQRSWRRRMWLTIIRKILVSLRH